jgi:AcrR family transcriptional regulator
MPKAQRSPVEIEAVRQEIMALALEIIVADGFDGLSMRKLAARLNVTAKTIYNYFHNKDELYLCLLTKGFAELLDRFEAAVQPYTEPMDRFAAAVRAYIDFGLQNAHIYNLMFTWHVPKYNDYLGSPMERTARAELETALKAADFFIGLIKACLGDSVTPKESDIRFEMIQIWSHLHGFIAGVNNHLLDYLHDDPISLKERIIDRALASSRREMDALKKRLALKIVTNTRPHRTREEE